jgi:hypothetical protein
LKGRNLVEMPPDIPTDPEGVYRAHWKDWADWLGHGRRIGGWRAFGEAREYARKLSLKSHKEWTALAKDRSYANKNRLPDDIPAYPDNVYDEWIGWWDWLGTPHRRGKWMSFVNARTFSRKMGLATKSQFIAWRRGLSTHRTKCPSDMPFHPERVYLEFKGWPHFLGGTVTTRMTFEEARTFVRQIGIKNQSEYREWVVGRLRRPGLPARPKNMPTNPNRSYSGVWKGYNDFLGTHKPRNIGRTWRPFEAAREYVRSQKLANVDEYMNWARGKLKDRPKFPDDLPSSPYGVYDKEKNWKGFSDFLDSKPSARYAAKYVEMWPFSEARNYVRSLKFASSIEYFKWAKGGWNGLPKKPAEVPAQPWLKYRNEWRGWDDWLG